MGRNPKPADNSYQVLTYGDRVPAPVFMGDRLYCHRFIDGNGLKIELVNEPTRSIFVSGNFRNLKTMRELLTFQDKMALYRAGKYEFSVPSVSTGNWGEGDWIAYIDGSGNWITG